MTLKNSTLFHQSEAQISLPYLFRIKQYHDHLDIRRYNTPRTTLSPHYELSSPLKQTGLISPKGGEISDTNRYRSLLRTKQTLTDIVLMNDFDMFATFTFKKDRYNIEKCKNKMSNWLQSQQKKYGKFQYLIVPEFHKDKALHFHALLQNYNGQIKPATSVKTKRPLKTKTGLPIYNITSYQGGFSTITKIQNKEATSKYIRKYITKSMPQFNGKKRYWCSNNLQKPITIYDTVDPDPDKIPIYGNDIYTNYKAIL